MSKKISYWFRYVLLWLLFFQCTRFLFVCFHFSAFQSIDGYLQKMGVFRYGLKLDLSTTGYLLLLPTLLLIIQSFFKVNWSKYLLRYYTQLLIFIITGISVADFFLFSHWGFRMDSTPLMYLQNAGEVINFAPLGQLIATAVITLILTFIFSKIYTFWVEPKLDTQQPGYLWQALVFLLLGVSLILPIRGGIGLTPLNLSHVFFSDNVFANQATINIPWNIIYSISEQNKLQERYQYLEESTALDNFKALYPTDTTSVNVLKTKQPNIVLVVLESFTSKLINRTIQDKAITPGLNQLIHEGIYFPNCYASGSRTDKGLVAIMSGYPAMPRSAIINYQKKVKQLPALTLDLEQAGYHSKFYYGGDINFANQKSYLLLTGQDEIIDKRNFSAADCSAKWGAHDHVVFEKLFADLEKAKPPYFHTLLSLSSHEPFSVPIETVFEGKETDEKFANSAHYTDQALSRFVEQLKNSPHWENLLLVLIADHGTAYLGNTDFYKPEKFNIPMLWLGGALAKDSLQIKTYISQTDFAPSLLQQLDLAPQRPYLFSKNIFNPTAKSFAYYSFNNGAGFIGDSLLMIYNNRNQQYILKSGDALTMPPNPAQSYLQVLSKDYFEK